MRFRVAPWIAVICLLVGSVGATSIPAWLDDAISGWNSETPDVQIEFVDIKDSYVWYMLPDTDEIDQKGIRESVYAIVLQHGYKITAEEELITTGKPPSPTNPSHPKKCWTRSFVQDIEELSNTVAAGSSREDSGLRQRMLTSMVCEDGPYWFTGFRILQ